MPENDPENYDSAEDWMEYCVDDDQMRQEYPDAEKRRAVCYAMYTGGKAMPEKVEYMRTSAEPNLKLGGKEDENGWIEGYAATFGNIDNYDEAIEPGAFQKTIQERVKAGKVKLMVVHFAHGGSTRDIIGTVTEAKEDEYGLWIHGEFTSTDLAQDTRTQVTEGHVENMSVGYVPIDWETETDDDGKEVVRHKEMALYDVVITAVPVNEQAVITAAKTASTAADCLQSKFIQDAKAGPDTLEAYRDRLKAAAKSLRDAADTLEAVGNTSDPGDTGKAVARWMSKCKRKRVELEELLIETNKLKR